MSPSGLTEQGLQGEEIRTRRKRRCRVRCSPRTARGAGAGLSAAPQKHSAKIRSRGGVGSDDVTPIGRALVPSAQRRAGCEASRRSIGAIGRDEDGGVPPDRAATPMLALQPPRSQHRDLHA